MTRKKNEKDEIMQWKEAVAALVPAIKQEQSPARRRLHEAFDEITAAKTRGVTWQQLTDLMTAQGVLAAGGEPLTADVVRALYHSERYARGLRKKRRTKKAVEQSVEQQTEPPHQPEPTPARTPSKPKFAPGGVQLPEHLKPKKK